MEHIKYFKSLYLYQVIMLYLNLVAMETFRRHQRQHPSVGDTILVVRREYFKYQNNLSIRQN